MKIFITALLLFSLIQLQSQDKEYTEREKEIFVKIFIASGKPSVIPDSVIPPVLRKHQISDSRFRQILLDGFDGKKITLTEDERIAMVEIEQIQTRWNNTENDNKITLASHYGLEYEQYKTMEKRFFTDIRFQQSLLKFFEQESKTK